MLSIVFFLSSLPVNSKVIFQEANFYQDKGIIKKLTLGKGEIISSDSSIARVALSDPAIVDLQLLSEKQVFLRAKSLGGCTLLIWEKNKLSPARFDLAVWPDITGLTKQLHDIDKNIVVEYIPPTNNLTGNSGVSAPLPLDDDEIEPGGTGAQGGNANQGSQNATTNNITKGKIILKGEVANAETIAKALQIAGVYVGDTGIKIVSLPGGLIVENGNFTTIGDGAGGGAGGGGTTPTAFGSMDGFSFVSNRLSNLSRGAIVTTQQGLVISFLKVKDSPQIAVAIRFYEITKSVSKAIGVNASAGKKDSKLLGGVAVGGPALSQFTGNAAFNGGGSASINNVLGSSVTAAIFNPERGLALALQDLQERGEVKVLAEPTLIISNGEPASFLAGGEVPVLSSVITAGGTSQNIKYEPFGIKFTILPTILANKKIHLQVVPEIRDIDTELSNFIAPGSTTLRPPAFKTRRTQTQVELEPGQAFAISGLIREDNSKNLRKVPGAGDIPVLGSLFRSKTFRKGETELLVVVSPQIVDPIDSSKGSSLAKLSTTPNAYFKQIPPLSASPIENLDETPPDNNLPINPTRFNKVGSLSLNNPFEDSEQLQEEIKPSLVPEPEIEISKPIIKSIENQAKLKQNSKIFQKIEILPEIKTTTKTNDIKVDKNTDKEIKTNDIAKSQAPKHEEKIIPKKPISKPSKSNEFFSFDLFDLLDPNHKSSQKNKTAEEETKIIFKDKADSVHSMFVNNEMRQKPDSPPIPLKKSYFKHEKLTNEISEEVALSDFDEALFKKELLINMNEKKIKKKKYDTDLWDRNNLVN